MAAELAISPDVPFRKASRCADLARSNLKHLRPALQLRENGRICTSHENLRTERQQLFKKCLAPRRIEMRRDLVEKQDRRNARDFGDEPRMGEHKTNQQRLLLSRRGTRSVCLLRPMPDEKIACLRPDERAPRRSIAR